MTALMPQGKQQYFTAGGIPLVGGKVYTYAAGTTTPLATYTDAAAGTPNTNPVILDSRGEASIFFSAVNYKIVVKDSLDSTIWTQDNLPGDAVATVVANLAASTGSSLVGHIASGTGAVATTVQAKLRDLVSVFDFMTTAQIADVQSGVASVDVTAAIQAAVTAHRNVYFPPGSYKITSTITVIAGTCLHGAGMYAVSINAWGCDAFTINGASGDGVEIKSMGIASFSAVGVAFPKLYDGVYLHGTSANHVNRFIGADLFLRGWVDCINLAYTWSSSLVNIHTETCTRGINLLGLSVNNSITNSNLVANTGDASIYLAKDGAVSGEGLMISNTLMYGGGYGVYVQQFLALEITNCVIDEITTTGIFCTDSRNMKVVGSWIYAGTYGVYLAALGSTIDENISLIGNDITVTGTGAGVYIGDANYGVSVLGGSITIVGTSIGVTMAGQKGLVSGVYFDNSGSGLSVSLVQADNLSGVNHGVITTTGTKSLTPTEAAWEPTDTSGAGLSFTVNRAGCYSRSGNSVIAGFDITFPVTASGATAQLSVPFTTRATSTGLGAVGYTDAGVALNVVYGNGTSNMNLYNPVTSAFLTNANLSGKRVAVGLSFTAA